MSGQLEAPSTVSVGASVVVVDRLTNGVLGPEVEQLGPVADGGFVTALTAPGCWGPMITPAIRGGHEVTQPVGVAGAEVGDAIAIRIIDITVTSDVAASGVDTPLPDRFTSDPYCDPVCPGCGTAWTETVVEGIGPDAVRCAGCGSPASAFKIEEGYTAIMDANRTVGVTVPAEAARALAERAAEVARIPPASRQHSVVTLAPHDLVGVATRLRPFVGQLGTTPSVTMPDSHNAGDVGELLLDPRHPFAMTREEMESGKTDGHLDIDALRPGSILVCPVKVPGGGIYVGDAHALQGDGEIAGHTCDVAAVVQLQVHVIKGLTLDGPVLFPRPDDLPPLARPLDAAESAAAARLATREGGTVEDDVPISVIGTGATINAAVDVGLERAAALLGMSVSEVRNRATIAGGIEIGRLPGTAQVTFRAPKAVLAERGLLGFAEDAVSGSAGAGR